MCSQLDGETDPCFAAFLLRNFHNATYFKSNAAKRVSKPVSAVSQVETLDSARFLARQNNAISYPLGTTVPRSVSLVHHTMLHGRLKDYKLCSVCVCSFRDNCFVCRLRTTQRQLPTASVQQVTRSRSLHLHKPFAVDVKAVNTCG